MFMAASTLGIQLSDRSVDAVLMRAMDKIADTPKAAVNNSTAPNDKISLVAIFKSKNHFMRCFPSLNKRDKSEQ
ncbi:hypothetical protein D3C72_2300450 [compost metagenome]